MSLPRYEERVAEHVAHSVQEGQHLACPHCHSLGLQFLRAQGTESYRCPHCQEEQELDWDAPEEPEDA